MWPGEQHNGGEQNPQGAPPPTPPGPYGSPAPYDTPSPYAQPGYPPQQGQPGQQPGQSGPPDLNKQPEYPPTQPYGQPAQPPAPPDRPGPPTPPYAAPTQPYGQPGYGTPSPYQQPGYPPQQPPGGYPTPQNWGPPVPGGPGEQPPRRDRKTIAIAIAASVAVIAAIAVGAVYLIGDDKKDNDAKDASPTATAPKSPTATPTTTAPSPTSTPSSDDSADSPRGAPDALDVKPVIPGWKVVKRDERNVAFDVPPDWTVGSEGLTIGFEDNKGNPAVAMGAPAYYKHDWCKVGNSTADRATVGTKGANGAKSVRDAAEVQATSWAYWAYQDNGKGTFSKVQNSKAFHNAHGISGWQASATASHIPKTSKCSADGAAYTVAWTDPTQSDPSKKLVVWVLYADRGVPDQLADSVIEKIKSSIRPLKK